MNTQDSYKDQLFSILGDSISTLDGYSIPDGVAFYEGFRKFEADVFTPADTWWGQVIAHLGGSLLVNHSVSMSTVCKHDFYEIPSYGCSDERTAELCAAGQSPDIIMVYMGTNDWGRGTRLMPENASEEGDLSIFSVAYRAMLEKLRKNYPETELWCFTLPVSTCTKREGFVFPYRYGGRHIEEYCEVIRTCAKERGCRVIDLYQSAKPYDTMDFFHPNAAGMKTLADAVICELKKGGY